MNYKKSKMGDLPGDLSIPAKIRMLEGDTPFDYWPWQRISRKCAKSFKRDHVKRANRRFRHSNKIEE